MVRHINICDSFLKREENGPILKRIITRDEKWIVYNNVKRKRSWSRRIEPVQSTAKANIHQKKVMLSVWWNWKAILFFELLPNNQYINLDLYCRKLNELDTAIKQKRPKLMNRKDVVFHHDNARPQPSLVTRQKLLHLGWDVLTHPPYSFDLTPSD